jgi:hypothetical protein
MFECEKKKENDIIGKFIADDNEEIGDGMNF